MRDFKGLTFRLPLVVAGLLALGGCYTMVRHPATDVTQTHGQDYLASDCASCHSQGFAAPLTPDSYGYTSGWFADYYGCPWWVADCGGPGNPYYSGGHGGDGSSPAGTVAGGEDRNVGSRGDTRGAGIPSGLPAITAPPAAGPTPGSNLRPSPQSGPDEPKTGPQPGRTMKNDKPTPSPAPPPPPAKDTDSGKDKPKDKPDQGGGR